MQKNLVGLITLAFMLLSVASSANVSLATSVPSSFRASYSTVTNRLALVTEGSAPASFLYGDVDGNSMVNVADSVRLERYIIDANRYSLDERALMRSDVNEDGIVNIVDSYLIRHLTVNILTQAAADRKLKFGDINSDGLINVADVVMLNRAVAGIAELNRRQMIAGDVDLSGNISSADVEVLLNASVGVLTAPSRYGDLNGDFRITTRDFVLLSNSISGSVVLNEGQKILANTYYDSTKQINSNDLNVIRKYISRTIPTIPVISGDLNSDGRTNIQDLVVLNRISSNLERPTNLQLISGDINNDTLLNGIDVELLRKIINGTSDIDSGNTNVSVRITAPNGGENFIGAVGTAPVQIRWAVQNMTANDLLNVNLVDPITLNSVQTIATGVKATDEVVSWWVPSSDVIRPGNYKIRINCVKENDNLQARECQDVSDATFEIVSSPAVNPGAVRVTSPNGGEVWALNTNKIITWTDSSNTASTLYTVYITESNGNGYGVAGEVVGVTQLVWNVGQVTYGSQTITLRPGSAYYVQVVRQGSQVGVNDQSDGAFSITAPTVPDSSLTLTSPNGGEIYSVGAQIPIRWTHAGLDNDDLLTIRLVNTALNTNSFTQITAYAAVFDGMFNWTIPTDTLPGGQYKIQIICGTNNSPVSHQDCSDSSNGVFSITSSTIPDPALILTSPNGGESWIRGSSYEVRWSSVGAIPRVGLVLVSSGGSPVREWLTPGGTENDGVQIVTIPATVPAGNYIMELGGTTSNGQWRSDLSNAPFSVAVSVPTQPSISLTAPVTTGFAPFTAVMTLTLRNMPSCSGYSVEFGNGVTSAAYPSCPAGQTGIIPERSISVPYTYTTNGSFTVRASSGEQSARLVITVQAPASTAGKNAFVSFLDSGTLKNIPNATISLYSNSGALIGTQTVSVGSVSFANLAYGTYTARAVAPGYSQGDQVFIIDSTSSSANAINIIGTRN